MFLSTSIITDLPEVLNYNYKITDQYNKNQLIIVIIKGKDIRFVGL